MLGNADIKNHLNLDGFDAYGHMHDAFARAGNSEIISSNLHLLLITTMLSVIASIQSDTHAIMEAAALMNVYVS